jgi:hypothetical protein
MFLLDIQARLHKKRLSQVDRQLLRQQIDRLLALQGDPKPIVLDRAQKGDLSDLTTNTTRQISLLSKEQDKMKQSEIQREEDLPIDYAPQARKIHLTL